MKADFLEWMDGLRRHVSVAVRAYPFPPVSESQHVTVTHHFTYSNDKLVRYILITPDKCPQCGSEWLECKRCGFEPLWEEFPDQFGDENE